MKKLLKEAKRRYPVGTSVICLCDKSQYRIKDHSYVDNEYEIWFLSEDGLGILVYKNGMWASTTKEPIIYSSDDMKVFSEWIIDQVWDKLYTGGKSTEQLLNEWTKNR